MTCINRKKKTHHVLVRERQGVHKVATQQLLDFLQNETGTDYVLVVVEHRMWFLKERCRCFQNTVPFKKLPGMLIVQMVSTCNFWLNMYPPTDGISRNINPRELMTGIKIDYNKHMRAEFGECVQHDNSMNTPTTGAIATKPMGNVQGGHWFYSLTTG